jgi:large repetitive protein
MKKLLLIGACFILPAAVFAQTLVINEFLASNDTHITDPQGEFEDWVELYNYGGSAVDIAGMFFTDGEEDLWEIPADFTEQTTVPAGGYLILWFDKDSEDGPLHVEAKLSGGGESIFMYATDGTTVIDSYEYLEQVTDVSEGRETDNADVWINFETPTPGARNSAVTLVINEFLASNDTHITDPQGEFEDWVELFNYGSSAIDIAEMYFTDGEEELWQIPVGFSEETTIEAGEYLILWFDKDSEDGPLHVEAKLSGGGEAIFMYATDGTSIIDSYEYLEQITDVSEGREEDNGNTWVNFEVPTPGASNDGTGIGATKQPSSYGINSAWPNPFNPGTQIEYNLRSSQDVNFVVYNLLGNAVMQVSEGLMSSGTHQLVLDFGGNNLPAGLYLAVMKTEDMQDVIRLTYLK